MRTFNLYGLLALVIIVLPMRAPAQTGKTNITDQFTVPAFLAAVRASLRIDAAAHVYKEDVENITSISVVISNKGITSLAGIEFFTSLKHLDASHNQLTEVDVSKNTALTALLLRNNRLTEIDVSKNILLTRLLLQNNQITELDVSKNTLLIDLEFVHTKKV